MKLRFSSLFLVLIATLFIVGACSRSSNAKAAKGATVVAKVNGVPITSADIARVGAFRRSAQAAASPEEERKALLEDAINNEVIFEKAVDQGYHRKESVKRQIVQAYIRENVAKGMEFPDDELKKYFDENKDVFMRIRAAHILIQPKTKGDPAADAAALKTAQDVLKKVKAGGDFAELAKKYSTDRSAQRGGDLGFFSRTMMVKPFADAAFALANVGDVSEVVQTDFGFHIIKLMERKDDFEQLKPMVKSKMTRERMEVAEKEFMTKARKGANVKIYEDALAKVEIPNTRQPQGGGAGMHQGLKKDLVIPPLPPK